MGIKNGKKDLLMIFQITSQKLNKIDEQNNATLPTETIKPSNKTYKIRRIWNTPEHEPEHDFILGGYFKVMNPPDVFWVNTVKKIDGRLSGYYKEYGGCRGWVNLEYFDSTNFEGPKEVNETFKRKREESEATDKSSGASIKIRRIKKGKFEQLESKLGVDQHLC